MGHAAFEHISKLLWMHAPAEGTAWSAKARGGLLGKACRQGSKPAAPQPDTGAARPPLATPAAASRPRAPGPRGSHRAAEGFKPLHPSQPFCDPYTTRYSINKMF